MILQQHINYDTMSEKAARYISKVIIKTLDKQKICTFALSGGSSPKGTYRRLAFSPGIDWNRVFFFFVDERNVPYGHDNSNYTMIDSTLFQEIKIQSKNILNLTIDEKDPEKVASQYEKMVRNFFKYQRLETRDDKPIFDIMVLGIGPDGHTASLFPESPALHEKDRLFVNSEAPEGFSVKSRLTFTYPVLNIAKNTIFIVSGDDKKEIVISVLKKDPKYPASLVEDSNVLFTDFELVKGGLKTED